MKRKPLSAPWLQKTKSACGKLVRARIFRYAIVQVYVISLLVNLLVETFSRASLFKALIFLFTRPHIFLINAFIVSVLIAPSLLSKRRPFFFLLSATLWVAVGVIDFFLLQNRVTPFNGNDLRLIQDAFDVAFHYYTVFQLILLALLIVAVIALVVAAFFLLPRRKEPVAYKKMVPLTLLLMFGGFGVTQLGIATGVMAQTFPNIADAYHDYGLPYCFVSSLLDQGIDKPSDYSPEKVEGVISPLASSPSVTPPQTGEATEPNVIFIQLESFFDPKRIDGIEFSEDPIPTFTWLMQNYTSGFLTVPSISAGTANTEFEILTGMNMADFGTGEYPYKTILKTHTCESIAYNLKALGYTAHAIHNNTATFYGRNVVFSNLGFDTFDSIELMNNVVRNELNWAKDEVLYGEIIAALDQTPGADLVFTISVQGHGKYPDEDILSNKIELADINDAYGDETIYGLKYYITQLYEMDMFLAQLIEYLQERNEPTVLVLYGDHLPGFNFTEDDLNSGNLLQTEYVMWSNFDMEVEHKDLHAYQLSAYVMNRLNYHEGLVCKLHQAHLDSNGTASYLDELTLLSYDMLYGEMYCFDGVNPYAPTDIVFGFHDVTLSSIDVIYDKNEETFYLTVKGENFSPYTDIYINGERYKGTIYLNENEVFLANVTLTEGDQIVAAMPMGDEGTLRESLPYVFTASDVKNP